MTKKTTTTTPKRPDETDAERLQRLIDGEEERVALESSATKRNTVMRTLVMLMSELRKVRKDDARMADDLTEARVIEWYRRLSDSAAEGFMRSLGLARKKGSGLA